MKTEKVSKEKFNKLLFSVNRFWNGREGLTLKRAKRKMDLSTISRVYVRNDGWSIACSEVNSISCKKLWEDEWEVMYQLEWHIDKGYYSVKFYNHNQKKVMYFNGKNFEGFKSEFIHDEIESYEKIVAITIGLAEKIVDYITTIDIKVYPTQEDKFKGREIKKTIENIINKNEGR